MNQVFLSDLIDHHADQSISVNQEYFDLSAVLKETFMATQKSFDIRAEFKSLNINGDRKRFYNFMMNFMHHCVGELNISIATLEEQNLGNHEKYAQLAIRL